MGVMSWIRSKLGLGLAKIFYDLSEDACFVIDNGRIVACNPATIRMLGCGHASEVLNLHPADISPELQPDGRRSDEKAGALIGQALQAGSARFEWRHRRRDGECFIVMVTVVATRHRGRPVLLIYWHDIADLAAARATNEQTLAHWRETSAKLATTFEQQVRRGAQAMAMEIRHLATAAGGLSDAMTAVGAGQKRVSDVADRATNDITTLSTTVDHLAEALDVVARQAAAARLIANSAADQARRTNDATDSLMAATDRINNIVHLIDMVAGQTNLLALNATIEAARAGDAGRGFAVVANEVKALASQTAQATRDIAEQIATMQAAAEAVAGEIRSITATIEQIDDVSTGIDTAVDIQRRVTNDMQRGLSGVADAGAAIVAAVEQIKTASQDAETVATLVQAATTTLDRQAQELHSDADDYLTHVQAP